MRVDVSDPVIVIDQFEELFAVGSSPDLVSAFSERITEYGDQRAVVIVVRIDQLAGETGELIDPHHDHNGRTLDRIFGDPLAEG